jgi:hypothetical protein
VTVIAITRITIPTIAVHVITSVQGTANGVSMEAVTNATNLDGDYAQSFWTIWITIGVRIWGQMEMGVGVVHVAIPAQMTHQHVLMALVNNVPPDTTLSRTIRRLMVMAVSRITRDELKRLDIEFQRAWFSVRERFGRAFENYSS